MTAKRSVLLMFVTLLTLSLIIPAAAQEPTIVVDGLRAPRNLSFDSEGNLYIAEAGIAGDEEMTSGDEFGATSRITRVSPDGEREVVLHGFISFRAGSEEGVSDIHVTDESYWVLLNESSDFTVPFTHALLEIDRETGRVKRFIDLLTIELEQDPDGNPNQQSNPVDFEIADDGTIYIANAGCNCLLSWTEADGVQVVTAWEHATDNPVPTSVEIGPDGDLYIGFLTGFPFPQGGSRVERWSGGELVETYPGLTAVSGLLVTDDGTIYASEIGFETPGRVVRVTPDGPEPVLEGLINPFGLAQAPDGTIVVAVGSVTGEDGAVIVVPTE